MTDGRSLEELEGAILESDEYQGRIAELEGKLAERDQTIVDLIKAKREVKVMFPTGEPLRFTVFSDTQLGSIKERLDCLEAIYENTVYRGIKLMLHAGDVLDGEDVYRGHRYEVYKHGWDQQRDHFHDTMPRPKG